MEFQIQSIIPEHIASLKPYSSARDDYAASDQGVIFLDANELPQALLELPPGVNRYPGKQQYILRDKLAAIKKLDPDRVFTGNGSDEIIDLLMRAFTEPGKHSVMVFPPTFGMYEVRATINQLDVIRVPLDQDFSISASDALASVRPETRIMFICHPNNPTGNVQPVEEIIKLLKLFKGLVVVDEAYIDFSPQHSMLPYLSEFPNLVILQTFSKAYGLAGARIGVSYASSEIQSILDKIRLPYHIGKPSIDLAEKALNSFADYSLQLRKIKYMRESMAKEVMGLPLVEKVYPSDANFLLVKTSNAKSLYNFLAQNRVIVRNRSHEPGCEGCLRISIGTPLENSTLINTWRAYPKGSTESGKSQTDQATTPDLQLQPHRVATIRRKTSETDITLRLNLDGNGYANINTGLGFFDHMLHQIARHGLIDLEILARGDLETDPHHTLEDTAICLGLALLEAMEDKLGMERYGFSLPMDDSSAHVLLDLGGRSFLKWEASFAAPHIGDIPASLFSHFFRSLSESARCNIHISATGEDDHHKIEAIFKAFARTLRMAVTRNNSGIMPSSKGIL